MEDFEGFKKKVLSKQHRHESFEVDVRGKTLLHKLARCAPWFEALKFIVSVNPRASVLKDKSGRLPFHYAEFAGRWVRAYSDRKGIQNQLKTEFLLLNCIKWNLKANVIKRAWKRCRYNPAYRMCHRVQARDIRDIEDQYAPLSCKRVKLGN